MFCPRSARAALLLNLPLLLPAPVFAQAPGGASTSAAREPDVVVTAARLEQPLDETLASVTVIRRAVFPNSPTRPI